MQKIKKIVRVDTERKMLLTKGLTDNGEFIGSFSLGVQLTPTTLILHQLLCFVYFPPESKNYFQFL